MLWMINYFFDKHGEVAFCFVVLFTSKHRMQSRNTGNSAQAASHVSSSHAD